MNQEPAQHADCKSPLAQWDVRMRLVALLLLTFSFSAVLRLRAVPLMLTVTVSFWLLSGLRTRYLLQRLRYPSMLVWCMALALLLRGGPTVWYKFGSIAVSREGAQAAALLLARFYCILTLAIAFLSISPLLRVIEALRMLRVPFIMVDMALLMLRYLEVLKQDLHNMNIAVRLRGFQNKGWSVQTVKTKSWLAASLLLRSHERAEGVYKAMHLRGYGKEAALHVQPLARSDWLLFIITLLLATGIFWLG